MNSDLEGTIDFLAHADLATGLNLRGLGYLPGSEELDERELDEETREWLLSVGDEERERRRRQARLLAGALWHASIVLIDQLFEDIGTLRALPEVTASDIAGTLVLSGLPPFYAGRYGVGFAQAFLAATVEQLKGLASGWEPPACIAQELVVNCLIDQVEVSEDLYDLDLEPGWQGTVRDALLEDTDADVLFDPGADGIEQSRPSSSVRGPLAPKDTTHPTGPRAPSRPTARARFPTKREAPIRPC
ncbi:hypothetical protein [Sinomonas humi]|uniref:hypothetical protein n=1 Tax=Sinomonas humi TaxID=1338436 RepID=UPI00068E8B04|nr:hypothetical protein [Sinomonas humi]